MRPTIVFTPHFGGRPENSHRHQDLVRALGFECTAVPLTMDLQKLRRSPGGTIAFWRRELEAALDSIVGPKILFTFSFPSAATASILASHKREDIVAWICDGGPFADQFRCQWNYLKYEQHVTNPVSRFVMSALLYQMLGGVFYDWKIRKWARGIPESLPILSIRSGADLLVDEESIAHFFEANPKLKVQVLEVPGAGHLEGLKRSPEIYSQTLTQFLGDR